VALVAEAELRMLVQMVLHHLAVQVVLVIFGHLLEASMVPVVVALVFLQAVLHLVEAQVPEKDMALLIHFILAVLEIQDMAVEVAEDTVVQ
jgi:hypothetical protein